MDNINNEIDEYSPYKKKPEGKSKKFLAGVLGTIVSTILAIIMYAFFGYMEFGGLYHSWKKHNDILLAVLIPPLSWYRAVETFWHNDFAGVNWEEKLKEDGRYCIYLINGSIDESANPQVLSKDTEIFSKNVSKYPKEKLNILKSFSRLYMKYQATMFTEMIRTFRSYMNSREINLSHTGDLLDIENKLGEYLYKEDVEKLKIETNNGINKFKEIFPQLDAISDSEKIERLKNLEYGAVYVGSKHSSEFRKMFNEDI